MHTANIIEGFVELGHEVDRKPVPSKVYNLLIEHANRGVDSNLTAAISLTNDLCPIYINGEDFFDNHPYNQEWGCFRYPEKYKLYFRREVLPWNRRLSHEFPLPFGLYSNYLKHYNEQKEDLCIFPSAGEYPNRREIIRYIKEFNLPIKVGRVGKFRHSVTVQGSDDYYKHLNRAKVIISSIGWGQDTARFWEALSTGACVISEQLDLEMAHPFTHMENVIFFTHPSELVDIFNNLDSIDIETIGKKGREHALKYHMTRNRAKFVIDKALEYSLVNDI
jgi:hypothetical protein